MSLRILTYNVQCRPLVDNVDNEARAKEIARRIVASPWDYDVVCLNEVFDEDAREKFEAGLKSKYPAYVKNIGGDEGFASSLEATDIKGFKALVIGFRSLTLGSIDKFGKSQDSGLMLFSRFPFDTKPNPDDTAAPPVPAINWKPYSRRTGYDALSEKGALAARLLLPNGSKFVVSATHMQASDMDDEVNSEIRLSQFDEALKNMEPLLSEAGDRYDFVHCGDMNVNGAMTQSDAGDAGKEWKERFSTPMTAAADYWDAVAFEQSPHLWDASSMRLTHPTDPGITVPTAYGNRRYDYFLTRPGDGDRTLQHAFIDQALKQTTSKVPFLSDHWPLVADLFLDRRGLGSSAARGVAVVCDEATPFVDNSSHLREGQIDWFYIRNAGTYEFTTTGAESTLFAKDNLSLPLPVYSELGRGKERGVKYVLPDAPIFVKVQAADRHSQIAYSMNVRRYFGTSLEDAIVLLRRKLEPSNHRAGSPNSAYECQLVGEERVNDARYFQFDVLKTTSGKPQQVQLTCTPSGGGTPMRMIVGKQVSTDVVGVVRNTQYGTGTQLISVDLEAGHYFVIVQRQPSSGFIAENFEISWDSNVSVLYTPTQYQAARGEGVNPSVNPNASVNPLAGLPAPVAIKLHCLEETDSPFNLGADDIAVALFADGVKVATISSRDFGGGFDTGDHRELDPWIDHPITYVDRLEFKIVEEDVIDDDEGSIEVPAAAKYRGGGRPIERMLANGAVVVTERTDFSGGTYTVTMTLA